MPDWLQQIPEGAWPVISTIIAAIFGAIGWFGHIVYTTWKNSRLPFRPDKERYDRIIGMICIRDFYDFSDLENHQFLAMSGHDVAKVNAMTETFETFHFPKFINETLAHQESALREALNDFNDYISDNERFEFYRGTFFVREAENQSDKSYDREKKKVFQTLCALAGDVIAAYEHFQDYGNRYFAERLKEGIA